jgi:hypothetical protein
MRPNEPSFSCELAGTYRIAPPRQGLTASTAKTTHFFSPTVRKSATASPIRKPPPTSQPPKEAQLLPVGKDEHTNHAAA